jgi:hypothetical protein
MAVAGTGLWLDVASYDEINPNDSFNSTAKGK